MEKNLLTPRVGHVNFGVKIEKIRTPVAFICIFIRQPWKDSLGSSHSGKWVEGE